MPIFERNHVRQLLAFLVAASIIAVGLMGGMSGCAKTAVKEEEGGEASEERGGNGTERVAGVTGIAFVRDDHVYLAKADGTEERRLTSTPAGYGDLAFSPSGGKLAATKVEGDAMPQLVVIETASGKVSDVSWTNPEYSQAWTSADVLPWFGGIGWAGEDLLYCTGMRSRNDTMTLMVLKYDLAAHAVEVIELDAQNPAVSPDGKKLAFIRKPADWAESQGRGWQSGEYGDLTVRDLESGNLRMVAFNVFRAAFSPAGELMALAVYEEPDTVLKITDLEGKRIHTLFATGPGGIIGQISFSPAGDQILSCHGMREVVGEPPRHELFAVPANQDNAPLKNLGWGSDPSWSPAR